MTRAFGPYRCRRYPTVATAPGAFATEEIDTILALGRSRRMSDATILTPAGSTLDGAHRQSRVSWIHPEAETAWLFDRLERLVETVNRESFGFELIGIGEPLQFTEYEAPCVGYTWHADMVDEPTALMRKLSLTVQLSGPEDYDGGELELREHAGSVLASRGRGDVHAFPSWASHRVTPLARGLRRSLVAWVGGPPFR